MTPLDTFGRDDPVVKSLATLDEDLKARLLEATLGDIALNRHERLDPRRVSARVFARLGLPTTVGRRCLYYSQSWRWAVGALGAAIVIGAVVPNPVSAALGKVFHFVPGIGAVKKTTYGAPLAVLPHTVNGVWKGRPVQVTGVMVTLGEVILQLSGTGPSVPTHIKLRTMSGGIIALKSARAMSAVGYGAEQWTGNYYVRGNFRTLLHELAGTVIIGTGQKTRIPIKLSLAKGVRAMSRLGPTQTHHGVSLTVMTAQSGVKADLSVVAQYQGPFAIVNTVPALAASARPDIQITDVNGRHYQPALLDRLGSNNQLTFQPTPGVENYKVTVPEVDAMYSGQASVTIPVPSHGMERVDRRVRIGAIPIDITAVQRMYSGGWGLRFYLKSPSPSATKILNGLQVNSPASGGFAWKVDTKTGAVQWVEVGIKQNRGSATLKLSRPQVYIRGPWTFHIHLPESVPNGTPTRKK